MSVYTMTRDTLTSMLYYLYSTLGCHLCEQAKQLVETAVGPEGDGWQEIDIADSEILMTQYGIRIPVLQSAATKAELAWPFDLSQLQKWLRIQEAATCTSR